MNENGDATDGIVSGFATVAGRLHLDPQTGCPHAVVISLDKDPNDKLFGNAELSNKDDPEEGKGRPARGARPSQHGSFELGQIFSPSHH